MSKIEYTEPAGPALTNLQLELLKTFSHELSEEELRDVRRLLADFFARRAIKLANEVWESEGWNEEKVDALLNTKLRSSNENK